jgi:hypothetical protein
MKLLGRMIGRSEAKVIDADDVLKELFIAEDWKKFDKIEKKKVRRHYTSQSMNIGTSALRNYLSLARQK